VRYHFSTATMSNEARKDEIRRRITLAKYPRRGQAKFTDENDHNPLVLQDCPTCHGSGAVCEYGSDYHARVVCEMCGGSGVSGEVEPYFAAAEAGTQEFSATADAQGWLTCPSCRWRFTTRDKNAWTADDTSGAGRRSRLSPKYEAALPAEMERNGGERKRGRSCSVETLASSAQVR
jgi:DnaJ-class molecular chaperone